MSEDDDLRDGFGAELTAALRLRSQDDLPTDTVLAVHERVHRQRARRRLLVAAVVVALVGGTAGALAARNGGGNKVRTINPSDTTNRHPSGSTSTASSSTTQSSTTASTAPRPTTTTATVQSVPPHVVPVVTAGGVGSLRFGVATEADVRNVNGAPNVAAQGSFGVRGQPNYRGLGYGCSNTDSPQGIRIGLYTGPAVAYCRTVYYINVHTSTLAGFETTTGSYSTANGTTVGMTETEAARRESHPAIAGCFTGIIIGKPAPSGFWQVFVFVGVHPGDRVSTIAADSATNSVGVLFC